MIIATRCAHIRRTPTVGVDLDQVIDLTDDDHVYRDFTLHLSTMWHVYSRGSNPAHCYHELRMCSCMLLFT